MLSARILTALILIPLVLAGLFLLPPLGWGIATLAAIGIAAAEWANLQGYPKPMWLLIGANLLFAPWCGFARGWPDGVLFAVCGPATLFWIFVAPAWLFFNWRGGSRLATAIVGWLILMGAWVAIVQLQTRSPWLVLAAMAIVWIADTAAYFVGRAFGRRKLAPSISPGKTWEGVYGALVAVAAYALALVPLAHDAGFTAQPSAITVIVWVTIVVALALVSVVGDLFESLLKRHAGAKDSGTLLPGHGGILDRIDALLAAMPAAAILAALFLR